jgi:hypothetical protein
LGCRGGESFRHTRTDLEWTEREPDPFIGLTLRIA